MKINLLSIFCFAASLLLIACKDNSEKTKPTTKSITESVYASGIIKSKNQYQAFATVNGIIQEIYVNEGDTLKKGQKILLISNETQKLNKENALLSAQFSDNKNNQGKLN
ncbi:MAG: RND transporter, partial [Bacteroidota bacterium]